MGLGHIRRNLLIAGTLACVGRPVTTLLIAGAREASAFATPPGVDCLSLPALRKRDNCDYEPRHLNVSLSTLLASP